MTTAGLGHATGARLAIGALSRATGIPVETLRTWESRYGYPVPERKPSGHRVYPLDSVPRLRRISEALSRGHRAGQVLLASDDDLSRLLAAVPGAPPLPPSERLSAETLDLEQMLLLVETFDADRLTRVLLGDWARLGPVVFLETRVAPFVRAVGDGWEKGRFEIRHEHFLSERIGDLLRSLRLPFEERATGPLVVLGSLPGEAHGLGLQMAALALAASGCRVLFLGTEVPPSQMVELTRDLGARALAISLSLSSKGPTAAAGVRQLRQLLPRRLSLLVGGDGAPKGSLGVELLPNLSAVDAWGRRATADARPIAP